MSHVASLMILIQAPAAVPSPSAVPPIAHGRPAPTRVPRLLRWVASDVRCGATRHPGSALRRPYSGLVTIDAVVPQTYRFRVGAGGRPLGIARTTAGRTPGGEDIAPSLAASRLPADAAGTCEVTYAADLSPLADAPVGDLVSYTLTPLSARLPEEGWARIRPAGGDCDRAPRTQWRVQVTPDWPAIPSEPGARDWSLVRYDLDAGGRPRRIDTLTGTGNPALDRAALRAMAQSRRTGGPRRGCLNPFVRPATRLAAPADADLDALRPAGATCPRAHDWARAPVLTYPAAWRRRSIEGWAVVAYDVAPWGQIGNVRVLAAEPAAEFGEQAVRVVRSAARPTGGTGATGCVERVRFAMGPDTIDPN